jgi:hypothetical protein
MWPPADQAAAHAGTLSATRVVLQPAAEQPARFPAQAGMLQCAEQTAMFPAQAGMLQCAEQTAMFPAQAGMLPSALQALQLAPAAQQGAALHVSPSLYSPHGMQGVQQATVLPPTAHDSLAQQQQQAAFVAAAATAAVAAVAAIKAGRIQQRERGGFDCAPKVETTDAAQETGRTLQGEFGRFGCNSKMKAPVVCVHSLGPLLREQVCSAAIRVQFSMCCPAWSSVPFSVSFQCCGAAHRCSSRWRGQHPSGLVWHVVLGSDGSCCQLCAACTQVQFGSLSFEQHCNLQQ